MHKNHMTIRVVPSWWRSPSTHLLTFDNKVGCSLEVLGGEFDLSSFIQLDVSHSQAVDFTFCLQPHL